MIRPVAIVATIILSASTLLAQTLPPAPPAAPAKPRGLPAAVTNRAILLVNAAGLSDDQMESIRAFAQKDLWVKVEAVNLKADWASLPDQMPGFFTSNRMVVVALGKSDKVSDRILAAPDNAWAVVNVGAVLTLKEKQDHMLKQQTLRGIGYAIGMSACLDRFCSMRSSKLLAELIDVGNNYCPSSRKEYQNLAVQKGIFPVNPIRPPIVRKPLEKKADPAQAPAPAPAKP
jgi:hypothetical protein